MLIKSAKFSLSSPTVTLCPQSQLPEYAFIGRSNVGKSSLINMLAGTTIAHTSSTPGKTRLINYFLINQEWHLVDLPGYGWAKVRKTERENFGKMIEEYISQRQQLRCLFVLIDIRLEMQAIDRQFMEWLGENDIPFVIIFTKADKLSKAQASEKLATYQLAMLENWEEMPMYFVSSSAKQTGKEEILAYIDTLNQLQ